MENNTEIKQVLYADDITLFIKDISSVKEIKHVLEGFYKISGLKLNKDKTYILPLGPHVSKGAFMLDFDGQNQASVTRLV